MCWCWAAPAWLVIARRSSIASAFRWSIPYRRRSAWLSSLFGSTEPRIMARPLSIAGAQLGPIGRKEPRRRVIPRLIQLMREAKGRGAELVVFPELALTTFFPRWHISDGAELNSFYETEMPSAETAPLFEEAKRLSIAFHLGYAELTVEDGREQRFNSAVLVDRRGGIIGKYRKIHLPGHKEPDPARAFQHLEKRYFEPGNLGFRTWETLGGIIGILIC